MKCSDLSVGHRGEGVVDAGRGGGHGQQGRDGQHHPGWGRLVVQPEGHPGHADRHEGGDVDCEDVVGELEIMKIFDVDVLIFSSMDKAGLGLQTFSIHLHKVKFMYR